MALHTDAVAKIYARSLYELAEQAGGQDKIMEVGQELDQTCELARGNRTFREFLGSPIIDKTRRGASIRKIFDGNVTDLLLRFLLVLNDKGRLGHLDPICEAYDQLVHEAFGRIEVDVYTPAALDETQVESVKKRIGEVLGKEAVLYTYTDPKMIGGLKLRVGDQLIDGSVASRLRRMKRNLMASGGPGGDLHERLERFIEEGGES